VADATLKVEVTPEQTITNALIYYGNNISTGVLRSLGLIPGGQTSTFFETFTPNSVDPDWTWDAASYTSHPDQNKPAFWAMIGVYQGDTGPGVTVSFPNAGPIIGGATWASVFQQPIMPSDYQFEETAIINDLMTAAPHPNFPTIIVTQYVRTLLEVYGEPEAFAGGPLATDYGDTAVLVNFSDAAFGGTAIASLVPEPTTWLIIVGSAGVATGIRRRQGA
jgi:hypothetical protein